MRPKEITESSGNRKTKAVVCKRQIFRRIRNTTSKILFEINNAANIESNSFSHGNLEIMSTSSLHVYEDVDNICQQVTNHDNISDHNISDHDDPTVDSLELSNSNLNLSSCDLLPSNANLESSYPDNNCNNANLDFYSDFNSWVCKWKATHNISGRAITDMLHFLSKYHEKLPLDSRTILQTPKSSPIKVLGSGKFCYLGLQDALKTRLHKDIEILHNILSISFNIDGIPLFHSSNLQFWPILGLIKNFPSVPFVVGIYCGSSKPHPLSEFLNEFIIELNQLLVTGFTFNDIQYTVAVHSFICDAPARAFIKCTKSHTGYSSCDRCTIVGQFYSGRVVLNTETHELRTNESFRQQRDEDHHLSNSPLLELHIDLVKCFPIDHMHCICLGVMRKLLNTWIGGPLKVRIGQRSVQVISAKLLLLKQYIPEEFNRKPRTLLELARWKATELRTFLLYLGPLVLQDNLDRAIYENFLLLHTAVTILVSSKHVSSLLSIAKGLLLTFVKHSKEIYGLEFLVYNVHMLTHICQDVELYGSLDKISAFPFENYLGQIKKLVKSPSRPLEQIYNRLQELKSSETYKISRNKVSFMLEYRSGPLPNDNIYYKQYKKMYLGDFSLTASEF